MADYKTFKELAAQQRITFGSKEGRGTIDVELGNGLGSRPNAPQQATEKPQQDETSFYQKMYDSISSYFTDPEEADRVLLGTGQPEERQEPDSSLFELRPLEEVISMPSQTELAFTEAARVPEGAVSRERLGFAREPLGRDEEGRPTESLVPRPRPTSIEEMNQTEEVDLNFYYGENTRSGSRERLAYQYAVDAGLRGAELQAYMAQVNHESGGFSTLRERGYSYSKNYADMDQAWKDRLARDGVNASNATAASIFNSVYANRNGNGDFASGDGNRYRGRGFIQLTGRGNYRQIGEDIGVDLEANPELMENPEIAARASVAWWKRNVQPIISNSDTYDYTNVEAISGIVNTGSVTGTANSLSDRRNLFRSYSGN